MREETKSLCEALRRNAETRLDIHGFVAVKPDLLVAAADEIERNGSVQWGDLSSSIAERERAERLLIALQNIQGVALNGPPDDAIGRCDAIDQIVHEAYRNA